MNALLGKEVFQMDDKSNFPVIVSGAASLLAAYGIYKLTKSLSTKTECHGKRKEIPNKTSRMII